MRSKFCDGLFEAEYHARKNVPTMKPGQDI